MIDSDMFRLHMVQYQFERVQDQIYGAEKVKAFSIKI